jgi:oligopeptide/dipeptide ABC transporter ATP-binding protein
VTAGRPIIEAQDVAVTFENKRARRRDAAPARAVDGVDLEIMPGEIVALVGESGCGKTTLARTLLGLELPAHGEIRFEGSPLPRSTKALRSYRRHVQIVFQDPTGALNPRQTIYESVAEGLRIHKVPGREKDLVAGALARSGLRPPDRFFQLYPHEISGGQRQRVVIAGAIALEPSLIVADEPVASLDASVRGEILRLMLNLVQQTQVAMLIVTHDLGLAWNVADRIAVMYLGRIVELGTTEEVLEAPKHPYTRALLSVVPEIERMEPQILRGEPPDPTRIPPGCRFHPRCPVVASGAAAELGILERCQTEDPSRIRVGPGHQAACHAAASTELADAEPLETLG